ncbi:MAG: GlsB/YeaQ/YmgE family stress response membrane protein [Steroidobacteraceae bacterium]
MSLDNLNNCQGSLAMSIIAWIVLGLIAGFIASKIVNKSGDGLILDIVLGVVGSIVGGWLFSVFGMAGVSGLNIYSLVVAVIGAVVVLVAYHAITGRKSTL